MMSRSLILGLAAALTMGAAPAVADAGGFHVGFGVWAPAPAPAPVGVRHHRHHPHRCEYIPGHYETRTVAFEVPGYWRDETTPPVYREVYGKHGHIRVVMVRPATTFRVFVPARTEYRTEHVWVPGRFVCGCR
jgi:hypothetical protein